MQAALLRTGGKINFFLRITGWRPDGLHELHSLFMPVPEPFDDLSIEPAEQAGLEFICSEPGIDPACNTVRKAYDLFSRAAGISPAIRVRLRKGIPQGAGLGGGSADAGAFLLWLQKNTPAPLTSRRLTELARQVGDDVPFFLHGQPRLMSGPQGGLAEIEPGLDDFWVLLVCPGIPISTAWAYAAWDKEQAVKNLTFYAKRDKNHGSYLHWLPEVDNCFEPVVFAEYPALAGLKRDLLRFGAAAAALSGTGSTVFGLFRERGQAELAKAKLTDTADALYGPMKFVRYSGNIGV